MKQLTTVALTVLSILMLSLLIGCEDGKDGAPGAASEIMGPSGVEELTTETCATSGDVLEATEDADTGVITLKCVTP